MARRGKLTSSRMYRVVRGTWRGWTTLMDELQDELIREEFTDQWKGGPAPRAIRWGHHWEDTALESAGLDYGWELARPPFVVHPTLDYIGASSDALILDGFEFIRNVEVKCPITLPRHTKVVMNRQIPSEHYPQMTCQLAVHDLPMSYFVSYHPEMPDPRSQVCVLEYFRDLKLESEALEKCHEFMEIFRRGDRPTARQVPKGTGFPSLEF